MRTIDRHDRYRAGTGGRWPSVLIVVAIHVAGVFLLRSFDVVPAFRAPDATLSVTLLTLTPPPAPPPPHPRRPLADLPVVATPRPLPVAEPAVVVPPRLVAVAVPTAPPVRAAPEPALPAAPAAPSPVARPIEPVSDLDTRLLAATPPRYPTDSRRKREAGVVVLMVDVGDDGRVAAIAVERSSGHRRLDEAARDAVRRWRWSPTLVDGRAVAVRGRVRIPFVLAG